VLLGLGRDETTRGKLGARPTQAASGLSHAGFGLAISVAAVMLRWLPAAKNLKRRWGHAGCRRHDVSGVHMLLGSAVGLPLEL